MKPQQKKTPTSQPKGEIQMQVWDDLIKRRRRFESSIEKDKKSSGKHTQQVQEDLEQENQVYIVEQILKKKKTSEGKIKYFIKWQGFPPEESTWEPEENLAGIKNMIQEFEANLNSENSKKQIPEKDSVHSVSTNEKNGDDEEYVVEEIKNKKIDENGQVFYKIKWKDLNKVTWESAENLRPIEDMIELYENSRKQKEQKEITAVEVPEAPKKQSNRATKSNFAKKKPNIQQEILSSDDEKTPERGFVGQKQQQQPTEHQNEPEKEDFSKRMKEKAAQMQAEKEAKEQKEKEQKEQKEKKNDKKQKTNTAQDIETEKPLERNYKHNFMMPPSIQEYEEGSFLKFDKVHQIEPQNTNYNFEEGFEKFFFKVSWQKRQDGKQPSESFFSYQTIKLFEPYVLIEYWEKWNDSQEEDNLNKMVQSSLIIDDDNKKVKKIK